MTKICTTRTLTALFLTALLAACGGGDATSTLPPPAQALPIAPPAVTPPVVPPVVTPPVTPPVVTPPVSPPATVPPLQYPIPGGLWSAPSGATPAGGNYVYLQSDGGDYIGAGRTYVYTNADTLMSVSNSGLALNATVSGNQYWNGGFLLPSAAATLQAGYFKDLTRTPFANAAVGGVEWTGNGRGCNNIKGWLVIDKIVLVSGALDSVDLRFEQSCDGGPALHGQIHWSKADVNSGQVSGPDPIPAGLWRAGAGTVPASGNYVYLESTQGDYIGAGRTYSYNQSNATIKLSPASAYLGVSVAGDQNWTGDFQGLRGMSKLSVGYYAGLSRYPFNNPVLGGMSWSGEGRGCNTLIGWFIVDKATYNGSALTALDLRFEQRCEGGNSALHGQLHWTADDVSAPSGPQSPPPANLWKPDPSFVAPTGDYVFLVSDSGDYIGAGRSELLTPANSTITLTTNLTAALRISVGGWGGDFVGMTGLSQLQPGYYGDLQRYPFHNVAKGGMDWSGNGRGCNTLKGWFVVDKVSYSLGQLTSIDLRFEQHCEGGVAAQHGVIHWAK